MKLSLLLSVSVAICFQVGFAQSVQSWPDTFIGRLEALALVEKLDSALLASRSATLTLESWCAEHRMATPARIAAIPDRRADRTATEADRGLLAVGPGEAIRYRQVRLACGVHILSEADNWYVPSRLTPEMNHSLETSDEPFGRVVQPLHPVRQTLSVERLWSPLAEGWEMQPKPQALPSTKLGSLAIPYYLFRDRAVLLDSHNRPIALVSESYTGEVLNFAH
jgi:hypothetical protein